MVFCDVSKAFDRVWHHENKNSMMQWKQLLGWLASYISDRSQSVLVNGASKQRSPSAGIHQGKIVGPFLFIVYINDIANDC